MYQVSDAYKAAVKKQSRDWKARIGVSYKDGTSADFTDDAITGGITIYSQAVSGDAGANTIDIGAAPESWIEVTLIDSDSNLHRYAGAVLSLTVSLKLESGEYEDVPMGVFWVDTGKISRQGTHINIVAYDSMVSYNYTLTDSFRASLKGMTAAEAAFQLTHYSKARYRQDMDISGYPNSDIPLDFSNTQIVTGWDAIMWIAQLMGCFAHIGRLNTLEFVQIKSTWEYFDESHTTGTIIVEKNIGVSERYRTTFADDRIHIIGVSMPNSKNNIITRSGAYLDSDTNVIIALERNPLIKDDAIEDVLTNMLVPLSTAYFYSFSSEVMSDPALDVGDMVRLQGGVINGTNKNNDLIGFITHNTWRYRGRQEIVNTGQASDVESDTAPTSGDAPFYSTPKTQTEKLLDSLTGSTSQIQERVTVIEKGGGASKTTNKLVDGQRCLEYRGSNVSYTETYKGTSVYDKIITTVKGSGGKISAGTPSGSYYAHLLMANSLARIQSNTDSDTTYHGGTVPVYRLLLGTDNLEMMDYRHMIGFMCDNSDGVFRLHLGNHSAGKPSNVFKEVDIENPRSGRVEIGDYYATLIISTDDKGSAYLSMRTHNAQGGTKNYSIFSFKVQD